MVVLPPTGASLYNNCCIDGGTGLEHFGYLFVYLLFMEEKYYVYRICIFIIRVKEEGARM
jgi:hypothetical protein